MDVNDNACCLDERGVWTSIASRLAATGGTRTLQMTGRPRPRMADGCGRQDHKAPLPQKRICTRTKKRTPGKTKSSRGFPFPAVQTGKSITLILRPKLRTVFSHVKCARLAVFLINTHRIHIQSSRLTHLRCRRNHWQSSVRCSNGRRGTKNRQGETKTDNAFHDVTPEAWEEDGPTVVLELQNEKTP